MEIYAYLASILIGLSLGMIGGGGSILAMIKRENKPTTEKQNQKNWSSISGQGFFVGCVTGLVGAGGGFLIVPALVNLIGLNMRIAIATSLAIIAANSIFRFSVTLTKGLVVDWPPVLGILSFSLTGLVLSSLLAKKVSEQKQKKALAILS